MIRHYTITVDLARPLDEDCAPWTDLTPEEQRAERRDVEREMLRVLRRVEGDADVEVIETTDSVEDEDPREKGDDDGREYGDPRDVKAGLE